MPAEVALRGLAVLLALTWLVFALLLATSPAPAGLAPVALAAPLVSGSCLVAALRYRRRTLRTSAVVLAGLLALLLSLALLPLPLPLSAVQWPNLPADPTSPGGTYAITVAAVLSALYAGLLLLTPRAALGVAAGAGGLLAVLAGVGLAGGQATSGAAGVPSGCLVPSPTQSAQIQIVARAEMDGRLLAQASLAGQRSGTSEQWLAETSGAVVENWSAEYVQLGGQAWLRRNRNEWTEIEPPATSHGSRSTLDGRLLAVLAQRPSQAFENLGVDASEHGLARHCRVAIDGTRATGAALPLAWLVDERPLAAASDELLTWRGELDWWIGAEDRLLEAQLVIGGHPRDAWGTNGLRGLLVAEISVEQPDSPPLIEEPLP